MEPTTEVLLKLLMELFYIGIVAVLLVHCLKTRGKAYAARIFGIGYVMGLLTENSGVIQGCCARRRVRRLRPIPASSNA